MSSDEQAERLARALQSLQFVEPVSWETQRATVKVLCRIQPTHLAKWAQIVEHILKRGEELVEQDDAGAYDPHICRKYLLVNGRLVYAWFVAITSRYLDDALSIVVPIIKGAAPPPRSVPSSLSSPPVGRRNRKIRKAPSADVRGNPIVPAGHRVTVIPMAGLDPRMDRNAPSDESSGKGAYSIFKSKRWGDSFKPPGT